MKYGIRLKAYLKKPLYNNRYIDTKINGTEFEHKVLKGNKHRNIPIEPKKASRHECLSIILLNSILIYPDSYCLNKYYPQIFFKICIYKKR